MCCFGRKRFWVLIGGLLLLTGTFDFFYKYYAHIVYYKLCYVEV